MTDVLTDETEIERMLRAGVPARQVAQQLVEPLSTVMHVLERVRGSQPAAATPQPTAPSPQPRPAPRPIVAQPPTVTAPLTVATATDGRDSIAALLARAEQSTSKRVQKSAARARAAIATVEEQFAEVEQREREQRELAEAAERARAAQERERQVALVELRQAEAALKAAQEKARAVGARVPKAPVTTPGAGTTDTLKAKRTYSPESMEKMRANAARMRERKAAAKAAAAGGK